MHSGMALLFPDMDVYPRGFSDIPDFVSPEQEQQLLAAIENIPLHTFLFRGYEAKRKVASFGYDYNFTKRTLTKGVEIPTSFHWLVKSVADFLRRPSADIGELLVTEYPANAQINWHRDAFPFDIIAGISLRADCTFRLRPHDKANQGRGNICSIHVSRRSMYILRDVVRDNWEHSIAAVHEKRYSITLRTLRQNN